MGINSLNIKLGKHIEICFRLYYNTKHVFATKNPDDERGNSNGRTVVDKMIELFGCG